MTDSLAPSGQLFVGVGPFTCQTAPQEDPAAQLKMLPSLGAFAEQRGYDGLWLSEHHLEDDGYLGAMFPALGALAASTKSIVLGTRVALAPLYHPLRLAEDGAAIAILSGGRFILGLGCGYRPEEFSAFGESLASRASRMVEAVTWCRSAWSGQPMRLNSDAGSVEGLRCLPVPPVAPALWLGGAARPAVERAARLGDGFVAPLGVGEEIMTTLAVYDAARQDENAPPGPVCTSAMVAIQDSPADESAQRGMTLVRDSYSAMLGREMKNGLAVGSVDTVVARLMETLEVVGRARDHHLTVRLTYPGMSFEDQCAHIDTFAHEVMPVLRARWQHP